MEIKTSVSELVELFNVLKKEPFSFSFEFSLKLI